MFWESSRRRHRSSRRAQKLRARSLLSWPSCRVRQPSFGLLSDPDGPNDEPLWGGPDEVERIACDQGQDFVRAGVQHRDIRGAHDPGRNDAIAEIPGDGGERDNVVLPDVSQRPEEGVAMAGDAD